MQAVLIANPEASTVTSAGRRVAERALEATFELELVSTARRGHAAQLARDAVEAGAKTVIAYGGDGTVNEVVNGLLASGGSEAILGVLPGGGTNVVARNLGYPNDLVEATAHLIDLVDRNEPDRLTVGRLSADGEHGHLERHFTFASGLMLDADAVRRVDASGKRARFGDMAFVYYALRAFFAMRKHEGPSLLIRTPDGDVPAWWAVITASDPYTYLGKRAVTATPGTLDHDGLDLLAAGQVRFWRTLRWVQQALGKGKQVRHGDALFLTDQSEIAIRTTQPVPLQADGEFLGDVTRVDVRALPRVLPVWA